MELLYALMNIVGPFLPMLTLAFFAIRQWKMRAGEDARSDAGARRLRDELNREVNS